jgi:hypothetical protein
LIINPARREQYAHLVNFRFDVALLAIRFKASTFLRKIDFSDQCCREKTRRTSELLSMSLVSLIQHCCQHYDYRRRRRLLLRPKLRQPMLSPLVTMHRHQPLFPSTFTCVSECADFV